MSAATDSTSKQSILALEAGSSVRSAAQLQRWWWLLAGLLAVVTIAAFIAYPILAFSWRSEPFFGALLSRTMVVDESEPTGNTRWLALAAGLRPGDHILAIDGQTLSVDPTDYARARASFDAILDGLTTDQRIEVSFSRPVPEGGLTPTGRVRCGEGVDGFALCSVSFLLSRLPGTDLLTFFGVSYVAGLLTLGVGLSLLVLRRNEPVAFLAAAISFLAALVMGGFFDTMSSGLLTPLWLLALSMLGGALATLGLIFPVRIVASFRRAGILYVPFTVNTFIVIVVFVLFFRPGSPQAYSDASSLAAFTLLLGFALLAINMWGQRQDAASALQRNQSGVVLIGLLLSALPLGIWAANIIIENVTDSSVIDFNIQSVTPFLIILPISIAYALFQEHTSDVDRIISRGITYALMLATLVAGYSLAVLAISLIVGETFSSDNPILIAGTVFIIAALFLPVRTRLQERIDQIYYRKRTNYQERIEAFAHKLTNLSALDEIIREFCTQLDETILPEAVFIFLTDAQSNDYIAFGGGEQATDVRFGAENGVVSYFVNHRDEGPQSLYLQPGRPWPAMVRSEASRLSILQSLVITPLIGRDNQVIGFASVSAPRSGEPNYDFEDLRHIQNLTTQAGIAIVRAQAVNALERRVRELDVLSQVSQAANFTVEFDDLLELISAQANKLVDATHFYIVLRDTVTDQLYFAFFLENDERHPQNENLRWARGNDLFSEVIRTNQAMTITSYTNVTAQRNVPVVAPDANLRAWMGVPLIAGGTTLGVMAAATTDPGRAYGEDQIKIFSDIGSLAATSIDKARLFEEANRRARQLDALNRISQQLVAAELDLDNLLELITSSAVDILNSEAGSLLLTADDDSGDLEFKIAVGGSGQELVGSRLPKGHGLVGEVATSGEPAIVDNTAQDPRWKGEVAKEGEFQTSALLAVPLMAANKVVGVLEVLNKKDGTRFVAEDVDLLATFAGQAAVAIENARLFQMTDAQLQLRVSELEALERIDVELNRSLDLKAVAEITMRWAIANSGASAGVLGLVSEDKKQLQIIHSYGYQDEDKPEDAVGALWPLTVGIVNRVMRTSQPEVVPDVTIDPDFVPSLRRGSSQITVPMLSGNEITALIVLEKNLEPRLTLVDLLSVRRLADHASIAISNAQLYTELARANDSKSEFVSFVAHELKNPLTSIKGYSDMILSGAVGDLGDTAQMFLGTIRSNADRMNTLVSDLNDVTKLQTENMRMDFDDIDIHTVVVETLRPLQKQIEDKQQKLNIDMPDDLPSVYADQNRIIQVLTNLVSNAYKYTPEQGEINIVGKVVDGIAGQEVKGPALQVTVKDSGIGMSEEDLARLFTPYFRSENPDAREQPGTGLGLTITQGIIESHNGAIWVESVLGDGTSFHFTLPLAGQTDQAATEMQATD